MNAAVVNERITIKPCDEGGWYGEWSGFCDVRPSHNSAPYIALNQNQVWGDSLSDTVKQALAWAEEAGYKVSGSPKFHGDTVRFNLRRV